MMKIALCIVSALFALLSLTAALSQIVKDRDGRSAHILMSVGGLLLMAGALCCWMGWQGAVLNAAAGCALICAAAIWNGKRSGNFHIQHHIVRIALSLVLVAGFALL